MKVLIAGDFAPEARLAKQIEEKRFSEIFSEDLRKVIRSADFSFVNFECPIVEEGYKPIPKWGPNLRSTPEAADAIKFAGFTGVTMANNHILDFGMEGLRKSVECCKSVGLDVVGVGDNFNDAEKVLYLEKNGKKIAVINCCEHEFSIASDFEAGANPLNPIRQFYAIQESRKNADYVLVIIHGGHEHYQLPSLRMVETYRFFIDIGADAVVNHHQHCYSGFETYHGKPIFYGLGNFCFDTVPIEIDTSWNYGYMVEFSFDNTIQYDIIPYCQYSKKATVELLDVNAFQLNLSKINNIITNSNYLKEEIANYYDCNVNSELANLEPYSGRIFGKLLFLGLLPRFIKGNKLLPILNHIDCESHRDKLLYILKRGNIK